MRFDRSISLGLVQPIQAAWRRLGGASPNGSLPILMYHSISDTDESVTSDYYKVSTSPRRFREQLEHLAHHGWRGVTLAEAIANLQPPALPLDPQSKDKKLFAITFDDGFQDFYSQAYPILSQCGFAATMYLPTSFIANDRRRFKSRDCLIWSEVRQLRLSGIEFGSHTVNHPKLVELSPAEIEQELQQSKTTIENEIGSAVYAFSYPYAFPQADHEFGNQLRSLLIAAGYRSCVTTAIGRVSPNQDLLQLPRLPVNDADDPALLEAKLKGAYDWMAWPQSFRKKILGRGHAIRPASTPPVPPMVSQSTNSGFVKERR